MGKTQPVMSVKDNISQDAVSYIGRHDKLITVISNLITSSTI